MQSSPRSESRGKILFVLFSLLLISVIALLPVFFVTEAQNKGRGDGLSAGTSSSEDGPPNYDIRTDKGAFKTMSSLRDRHNRSAADVADMRDEFAAGEKRLKERVPSLTVIYGRETRVPEVIAPDVQSGKASLRPAAGSSRADTLLGFIAENNSLFGLDRGQIGKLKVIADYKNPEGDMAFVRLKQEINGVPVFAGEVRAGFGKNGELVRVLNNAAAGVGDGASENFGDPSEAFRIAAANIGYQADADLAAAADKDNGNAVRFGEGDFAPYAEKIYFPTEPGVVVPAWRVLIWKPVSAYYVIVETETGNILWRKNIVNDQTQAATYNVWTNPNAMVNVADSPFPMTPGPTSPNGAQAGPLSRTSMTLVGNEAPYTFNNLGWINDGGTTTDGNAVEAGLDRDGGTTGSNGVDANGKPVAANRVFDFPINPGIPTNPALNQGDPPMGGNPTPCLTAGSSPAMIDFQRAAVTQLFYISNRYHDEVYRLGFTEAAGNFQHENFDRGGLGGDRVSAEAQDCSGTNNANFGTPADGLRGRMQMYIWTTPIPDYDGSLDADVVIHELTHGLSNRLHGDGAGLSNGMSGGMGEGWSDFYGHALLSEPTDPINGIYTTGGYALYRRRPATEFGNYYYGIRRFPKAVMAFTGGPNDRPHNPLTFRDIDSTQSNTSDGAFPPAATGSTNDAVHAAGEVWSSMLWEVRAKYIQRLGWAVGNRRVLQHVTDGMKLSPLNPTFVDARDAIVAAALASGTDADVRDIWAGFAIRGLGASAKVLNPGNTGNTARVTEAYDTPNLHLLEVTVEEAASGSNNNGFVEPGEQLKVTVPIRNITGFLAEDVTAQITGGGLAFYGSVGHNSVASNQINFTVPAGSACGSVLTLTINVSSSLGPISFTKPVPLGIPSTVLTENFDGVTAPAIPAGWSVTTEAGGTAFVTSTAAADSAPNAAFAVDPTTIGGGTSLVSPVMAVQSPGSTVSFRNNYNTEAGWDGGVLEISINGGAFADIIAAGGSWVQNGYNGVLGDSTGNPIELRNAWTGNSGGYVTSTALLPPGAAGQNVQLRWRFGADNNTAAVGWNVDSVEVFGNHACSFVPATENVRADFDGDGTTDFSVFRPSNAVWYVLGSSSGVTAFQWGIDTDLPVAGDFDGDGKTDIAVYRHSEPPFSTFYIIRSNGFLFEGFAWGTENDISVIGDYDGDGNSDKAVFRPSTGFWYVNKTTGGVEAFQFGAEGDVPMVGDFDGDDISDAAFFRGGDWHVRKSSGGEMVFAWGAPDDRPVPADYDGDGRDDIAVFRPSTGVWYAIRSSDSSVLVSEWGLGTDVPVPGNYDADNKADIAVFRDGNWYILNSTGGVTVQGWGMAGDRPIPASYIP